MAQIPFDIVGFDLDGTLVDSSLDLAAAVNHTLGTVGLPPHEVDEIKQFVGKGTRVMLERALKASGDYTPELLDSLTPVLMAWYQEHLTDHTLLYPGAAEAMAELRGRGVRLAICTNKFERFTLPLLRDLELEPHFDAIIGGDTVGKAKPHPEPLHEMVRRAGGGRCVFLGDTSNDIDGAKNAGLASIAVSFGFTDASAELGADAILHRFEDLVALLEGWGA
ncbi:MAG: phosphoglycolate phosphatase [Sphingobium sp.]|nr:phosphoglycolate phosphatase [Sphingobium sp.]MBP6111046.1 phosphoglycolate phosphatase [Sphingobium sp.]MBP8670186.1 phosphoglycolate phosphatase [Sphingobium sp.]MBP9157220.1 phosphoglycolate phosphatase [Sphingobium sp.]